MRITEQHIKSGYFWLPSQPENKIPGTLKISDGGEIDLEIIGNFDNSLESFNDDITIQRIVGFVEKDGYVTLDDCFYRNKNISFGCISKSLVHVNTVLYGAHYGENEELTFSTFRFAVEGLDKWLNICGIKVDYDFANKTATINYKSPPEESFTLSNGLKLTITFGWTLPGLPVVTEAKITQKAYIKLSSEETRPLTDFISTAYKITNLLCFALDATVSIHDVSATSSELLREISEGKHRPVPIKIFYPSLPFSEVSPKVYWNSMLFRFPQIKDNAKEIFNNWLNAYERIEPAFNLYFASKTGAHKYIDGKFLSLAQGIETFHRRTSDETVMPDAEFKDIVGTLIDACPENRKKWLEGKLTYSNELTFRTRLKQIVDNFKSFFGSSKDRKAFISQIVNTRNYLTHYDISLKSTECSGAQLFEVCMKMECLFQLHFLKEIGLSDEEIKIIAENNYKFKQKLK